MELILERIAKRKTYTIGRLCIRRQVIDEYLPGIEDQYFLRHLGTHMARLQEWRLQGKRPVGHSRRPLCSGYLVESEDEAMASHPARRTEI